MIHGKSQTHVHNFDFLVGSWKVLNQRKKGNYFLAPAVGEEIGWEEFSGRDVFEQRLDGRAIVEHWEATLPSGENALGLSMKAFEPATQQWSIVWIDNRNSLDYRPLYGTFENGVGTFFQVIEAADGQPLHVRFLWESLSENTARWQQAFSFDGGRALGNQLGDEIYPRAVTIRGETRPVRIFPFTKGAKEMTDRKSDIQMKNTPKHPIEMCCPVIELRQYTLKPGRRDDLIALFEEHFIEGQEQYGLRIIGQFRHRTRPDQFVWLRGFVDMEARRQALQGFYSGPIWQEHRTAANDTMIDSDNVLLLKPAHATSSFRFNPADRPALNAPETTQGGVIIATVYAFDRPVDTQFVECFEQDVAPVLCEAGATLLGQFVTEPGENTFPVLPVREGEQVFVWLASFADEEVYAAYRSTLAQSQAWTTSLAPALQGWLTRPTEVLELAPCRRSLLRYYSVE